MIMLNKIFVVGNLTRDPELKHTADGKSVTAFTIGINRRTRIDDGSQKDDVSFVEIKAWEKTAEDVCRYLKKGRLILVEGRIKQERWEAKDGGGPRSKVIIEAKHVQFLGGPGQGEAKASEVPAEEPGGETNEFF